MREALPCIPVGTTFHSSSVLFGRFTPPLVRPATGFPIFSVCPNLQCVRARVCVCVCVCVSVCLSLGHVTDGRHFESVATGVSGRWLIRLSLAGLGHSGRTLDHLLFLLWSLL